MVSDMSVFPRARDLREFTAPKTSIESAVHSCDEKWVHRIRIYPPILDRQMPAVKPRQTF
jgi:hypothetical protein